MPESSWLTDEKRQSAALPSFLVVAAYCTVRLTPRNFGSLASWRFLISQLDRVFSVAGQEIGVTDPKMVMFFTLSIRTGSISFLISRAKEKRTGR